MPARERMLNLAASFDGLHATEDPDRYLALVGPEEAPRMQHDMLGMSSSALIIRGLLRQLGLKHERLDAPYKLQHTIDDLRVLAREADAWRTPSGGADDVPELGDYVLVNANQPTAGVFIVVSKAQMPDRWRLESIDGSGQMPGQTITRITRDWMIFPGATWDHRITHPPTVRRVTGWADLDAIVDAFGTASIGA